MPRVPASAAFSIDGGPAVPFSLPVYSEGFRGLGPSEQHSRLPILITPPVANGHHTIDIVYLGNTNTVPLTLDYFIVAHEGALVTPTKNIGASAVQVNGTTMVSTTARSGPSSSPSPGVDADNGTKINTGAVICGVVGALLASASLVSLCFWLLRRRKKKRQKYSAVPFNLVDTSAADIDPVSRSFYPQPSIMVVANPHPTYSNYLAPSNHDAQAGVARSTVQPSAQSELSDASSSLGLSYVSSFASSPIHPLRYPGTKPGGKADEMFHAY